MIAIDYNIKFKLLDQYEDPAAPRSWPADLTPSEPKLYYGALARHLPKTFSRVFAEIVDVGDSATESTVMYVEPDEDGSSPVEPDTQIQIEEHKVAGLWQPYHDDFNRRFEIASVVQEPGTRPIRVGLTRL